MLKNHIKNKDTNNQSLFRLVVAFVMYSVILILLVLSFQRMEWEVNQQAGKRMAGFQTEVVEPLGKINRDINSVLKPLLNESVDYNDFTNRITQIETDVSRTAGEVQKIIQEKYPSETYLDSTLQLYKKLPVYIKTIVDVRKRNSDMKEESEELKELKKEKEQLEKDIDKLEYKLELCNYKLGLNNN